MTLRARIPFEYGWYCWDLGEYRPFPHPYLTYWLFGYAELPPLPNADANFGYLAEDCGPPPDALMLKGIRARLRRKLSALTDEASRRGLTIPESFTRFMPAPELHARFRSGTCYWFTLSNRLVRCPRFDGAYLICFLRDQQDCILWCLCLTPDGGNCVLAVPDDAATALSETSYAALCGDLGDDEVDDGVDAIEGEESAISTILMCADSFEEFVYRFWLEDEISFKLSGLETTQPLTDVERAYLEHYAQRRREKER
jgi:hypothetical protein